EEVTLGEAFGVSTLQLTVSALMTASSPELEQRLAKDTVGGFEGVDRTVEYLGDTPLVTDAGPGHALRWFGREGTNQILVFVPVCGGKITLVAHGRGEGPGLWREAKRALHGMRFDPAGHACKMVTDDTPPSSPPPSSPVAPALPAPAASSPPVASAPTPPPAPITLPASASPARRRTAASAGGAAEGPGCVLREGRRDLLLGVRGASRGARLVMFAPLVGLAPLACGASAPAATVGVHPGADAGSTSAGSRDASMAGN